MFLHHCFIAIASPVKPHVLYMMPPCELAVYVFFIVPQALYFYSFPVSYNRWDGFKARLDRRKMETTDEQST